MTYLCHVNVDTDETGEVGWTSCCAVDEARVGQKADVTVRGESSGHNAIVSGLQVQYSKLLQTTDMAGTVSVWLAIVIVVLFVEIPKTGP